jgi:hypothetical protein
MTCGSAGSPGRSHSQGAPAAASAASGTVRAGLRETLPGQTGHERSAVSTQTTLALELLHMRPLATKGCARATVICATSETRTRGEPRTGRTRGGVIGYRARSNGQSSR